MENKELETWLKETKAKNLSLDELRIIIRTDLKRELAIKIRNKFNLVAGESLSECLFNQWQKEAEFSPKRGDRVLVWDDSEESAMEKIFIIKSDGEAYPYRVVTSGHDRLFLDGHLFESCGYKNMKPLPTEQPTETDFKSQVIELIEGKINATTSALETIIGIQKDLLTQIKQL
jgi:hypothetical protein